MPIPHLPLRRRDPTRASRRASRSWRSRLRRVLPLAFGAVCLGLIGLVVLFASVSRDLPDPDRLLDREVAQSTRIFARDGSTLLYEIHGDERRTLIKLDDMPLALRQATVAIEDKDFYQHGGFSVRGFLRALWINVTSAGRRRPGGSTITQQFVKNAILTNEKTLTRKIKELVLSFEIERRFSKDQILQLYLNEIGYGSNNYGVGAAARSYFGKDVRQLTVAESALLAALPQAPTYYSPNGSHPEELSARHHHILDLMAEQGFITEDEAGAAKREPIVFQQRREAILAPHFVFYVRELLADRYPDRDIERGGYKVITTLDPDKQLVAEEEITKGVAANEKKYRATNAALVSLDVRSGEVLAMVGSRDFFDDEHDGNVNVALATRNPGSSFKPFVYAAAFLKGFTPETILYDLETNFGPDGSGRPYIPSDYDGKERGPVSMRKALAGSLNIPAVQALYLAGIPDVVELAQAFGYTTFKKPEEYGLALALGGAGARLLEHAAAFGVLAREGVRLPTTAILRVEDARGKVIDEWRRPEGDRVLDKNVARLVTSILSDNSARSFIFGARSPLILRDRPVAAKTGTTNDWRDGWTMGFTPSIVTGVWAGNNDNSTMARGADGVFVAAPIWNAYMNRVVEGSPVEGFAKPRPNEAKSPALRGEGMGEERVLIDRVTRKRIPADCQESWPGGFRETVTLRQAHSILHYVDKNKPSGPAPAHPERDPMYERWEAPVRKWVGKKVDALPTEESCDLRSAAQQPSVSFSSPSEGTPVSGNVAVSVVVAGPRVINSVAYALDGATVATIAAPPFDTTINLLDVAAGFHTITATVTDVVLNTAAASVQINVAVSAASALFFTSPAPGSIVSTSVPLSIRGEARHSAGVQSVVLFERVAGADVERARTEVPAASSIEFALPAPTAGDHAFGLRLLAQDGQIVTSDLLTVTASP